MGKPKKGAVAAKKPSKGDDSDSDTDVILGTASEEKKKERLESLSLSQKSGEEGDAGDDNDSESKKSAATNAAGKKGKKKKKEADWEDDVADELKQLKLEIGGKKEEEAEIIIAPTKKEKKEKEKKAAAAAAAAEAKKKKKEEDGDEEAVTTTKSAFQMLSMDSDDDNNADDGDDDRPPSPKVVEEKKEKTPVATTTSKKDKKKKGKGGKEATDENDDIDSLLQAIEQPKEKKAKKKKKNEAEEVNGETEGQGETEGTSAPGDEVLSEEVPKELDKKLSKKDKRKKKNLAESDDENEGGGEGEGEQKSEKEKKNKDDDDDDDGDDNDEGGEGGGLKTKAQKKKEKKEKERLAKLKDKEKQKKKEDSGTSKEGTPAADAITETAADAKGAEPNEELEEEGKKKKKDKKKKKGVKVEEEEVEKPSTDSAAEEAKEGVEEDKEDDDDDDGKKKKKDKKKKKGAKVEEEDDMKTKKPKNKALLAMQEALQKVKEEEDRIKNAEEEKQRKIAEAEAARKEKERKETERKEREKQKKKDKIARQKAEGTFLTEKQKQDRARAMAQLEALKQQGVHIPTKAEIAPEKAAEPQKKKIVYVDKKKLAKKQQQQQQSESHEPSPVAEEVATEPPSKESTPVEEAKPVVEVAPPEEPKDAWDAESEEEEEKEEEKKVDVAVKAPATKKEAKKKVEEESDEESDDDESDDDDDESSSESESDSDSDSDSDDSDSSDDGLTEKERARQKAQARIDKRREESEKSKTADNLRAPVVVVLGHVDTGKTKILDKLRRTNVQDGEAGGITQQIGATNVPVEAMKEKTSMVKDMKNHEFRVPGLLIIDTPGHESFSNLRNRGSSLCDIAILVVDIMHGLEPQTIESIGLLKKRKTPFIVALNKVDRLFGWKTNPNADVENTVKRQSANTLSEFNERVDQIKVQFAEQGLNTELFYKNKDPKTYISFVPTSAHTGDGMGNLVGLVVQLSENFLGQRLAFAEELQATVMEVKEIVGLGTTIDVLVVNGRIREGDTIIVGGVDGPIITQIRGLLRPPPMKELRVKSQYENCKEVIAAQGLKIAAKGLEKALAGLPLLVAQQPDEVEIMKQEIEGVLSSVLNSIKVEDRGVFVQASTLGSLEALLEFLKTSKIPYAGISIGPVHKRDIMKASSMLERDAQWAVILAFDVKVEKEAQEMADSVGVRIFTADIIYHLFDKFMNHREELKKRRKEEFKNVAVFPCKLRIMPQFVFNSRDPIVMGVSVEAGAVRMGTPICVPTKEFVFIGIVSSIEINNKPVETAQKGQEVCIKIEAIPGEPPKMVGRHFEVEDQLVSRISRESIDAVKNYFRDEMSKTDWQLMIELKKIFEIL